MAPSQPDAQNNPAAVAEGGQAPQSQQSIQMQPIASKPMGTFPAAPFLDAYFIQKNNNN